MHTRPESASEQHMGVANYTTASYRGLSGIRSSLLQSFPLQSDAAASPPCTLVLPAQTPLQAIMQLYTMAYQVLVLK